MWEIVVRFIAGGFIISVFALIGDVLKPKTFAGLFGAAPSVALVTLFLGALAFLIYASSVSYLLMRKKYPALFAAVPLLLLWLGVAVGLWSSLLK
jgi:hypothetical protein